MAEKQQYKGYIPPQTGFGRRSRPNPRQTTKVPDPPLSQKRDPLQYARFLEANDVAPSNVAALTGAANRAQPAPDGSRYTFAYPGTGSTVQATGREGPSQNTDKWDGFAGKHFVPGERDLLFNNPDIIVREWLAQGPYRNNPQMAGDLSRYANIVFGDESHGGLYELITGGSLNPEATGDDDMINYLVDLLGEQSKVGGRSPSIQQMLGLLFEGFNNPNSTMGGLLKGGDGNDVTTGQAINAVMQYIPLLGEFTGNRRYSDALYRQATQLAQEYMDRAATGKAKGSFLDFFQNNYLR